MPTHLYCLLPAGADAEAPPLAGIGGAPLRTLDAGPATAWVSDVGAGDEAPTAAALRAHDAVTSAALARATPLPARFGQRFATDEECRRALVRQAGAIAARLGAVAGCVEMRVVLVPPAPAVRAAAALAAPAASGRAYLEEVRARVHADRALHERGAALRGALAALGGHARGEALTVRPGTGAPIAVAYLVPREEERAWRAAAATLMPTVVAAGERIALAGPVAPYTFAELGDVRSDA